MDNNSDIDLINNSLINLNITKKNSYEIINRFILKYIYKYKIKKSEPFNINIINIYLDDIININYSIDNINQNLSLKKIRKINFPSEISENIVKYCMFKKYNIMPQWDINYPGDLSFTILNKRLKIEV